MQQISNNWQLTTPWLNTLLIILQINLVRAGDGYCYFSTDEGGEYALETGSQLFCDGFYKNLPYCNASKRNSDKMVKWLGNICAGDKIWALNDSAIFNISLDASLQCLINLWCGPFVLNVRVLILSLAIIAGVCVACACCCKKVADNGMSIAASHLSKYISGNMQRFYQSNSSKINTLTWKSEEKSSQYYEEP